MTIRKTFTVRRSVEDAFRIFTEEMQSWWPLHQGYSFDGQRADRIVLEARVGGRLYERFSDGEEFEIGRVQVYEPPSRVVYTWRSPDWAAATEVEVRFVSDGQGTRVELEHRGWEATGPGLDEAPGYEGGWDEVLEAYADLVA